MARNLGLPSAPANTPPAPSGLPKIGPGPSASVPGAVPSADAITELFNRYTSGTLDRQSLIQQLRALATGQGGILELLSNQQPQGALPKQPPLDARHQEIAQLIQQYGVQQNDAAQMATELNPLQAGFFPSVRFAQTRPKDDFPEFTGFTFPTPTLVPVEAFPEFTGFQFPTPAPAPTPAVPTPIPTPTPTAVTVPQGGGVQGGPGRVSSGAAAAASALETEPFPTTGAIQDGGAAVGGGPIVPGGGVQGGIGRTGGGGPLPDTSRQDAEREAAAESLRRAQEREKAEEETRRRAEEAKVKEKKPPAGEKDKEKAKLDAGFYAEFPDFLTAYMQAARADVVAANKKATVAEQNAAEVSAAAEARQLFDAWKATQPAKEGAKPIVPGKTGIKELDDFLAQTEGITDPGLTDTLANIIANLSGVTEGRIVQSLSKAEETRHNYALEQIQQGQLDIAKEAANQEGIFGILRLLLEIRGANRADTELEIAKAHADHDKSALELSRAGLTGLLDGAKTFEAKQAEIQNAFAEAGITGFVRTEIGAIETLASKDLKARIDQMNSQLTGLLGGVQTLPSKQFELSAALAEAEVTGKFGGQETMAFRQLAWQKDVDNARLAVEKDRLTLEQSTAENREKAQAARDAFDIAIRTGELKNAVQSRKDMLLLAQQKDLLDRDTLKVSTLLALANPALMLFAKRYGLIASMEAALGIDLGIPDPPSMLDEGVDMPNAQQLARASLAERQIMLAEAAARTNVQVEDILREVERQRPGGPRALQQFALEGIR